nr:Rab family GTPase [Candidatus Sigynarchaeota archaeon]
MKTSVLYIIFDERLGPLAQNWLPNDLSTDLRDKVPMMVMNIASNMQELPKGVAIIPIPAHGMKSLVYLIRFENAKLRGGTGEAALVLLFDEADDAIVYRYLKQFEGIFEKHAATARELSEKKGTKTQSAAMLSTFHKEVIALLDLLEQEEKRETAFPTDDSEEEREPYKCKLVVIGDPDVGKTSLVIQFTEKAFRKTYLPTIGVNITEKTITDGKNLITFVIWDIAGQSKFTKMRKHFYTGASAVLLVFDLTKRNSLDGAKDWYEDIKRSLLAEPPNCILLGNKNDMVEERAIPNEEARALATALNVPYYETSAKTGQNVQDVFECIAKAILSKQAK